MLSETAVELDTQGKRLQRIFNELRLTIPQVAEQLKVSTGLLEQTVRDKFKLRTVTALALQAIYKINHRWLLTGDGPVLVSSELDEEEAMLVRLYVRLDKKVRDHFMGLLSSYSNGRRL